jgi:hypothetical protein
MVHKTLGLGNGGASGGNLDGRRRVGSISTAVAGIRRETILIENRVTYLAISGAEELDMLGDPRQVGVNLKVGCCSGAKAVEVVEETTLRT